MRNDLDLLDCEKKNRRLGYIFADAENLGGNTATETKMNSLILLLSNKFALYERLQVWVK